MGEVAFVQAPGARLAVREAGPPDAPPVVLLHGFSQGSLAWQEQLTGPLARRFRLVAPDLRGHGMSEAGPLDDLARGCVWGKDLLAVIAARCGRPPVVVAWSYGGRVACEALRLDAGALAGVVFVAAVTHRAPPPAPSDLGPAAAPLRAMTEADDALSLPAAAAFVDGGTARPLPPATRDLMIAVNAKVPASVRSSMQRLRSDNEALLREAILPALILHGADDAVVRPEASSRLADWMPHAEHQLWDGIGHAPFLEDPERFDAAVERFAAPLLAAS